MKTIITSKLTRKCLILAFMIIGLIYVASSDRYAQPVAAAPCCENCTGRGDPAQASNDCFDLCPFDIPCYNSCMDNASQCYNHCVFCNGGGGGEGGYCNSSDDCLSSYYCGADNECHYL